MVAITRELSPAISNCELTFMERSAIDFEAAESQHADYVRLLRRLGLEVIVLPPEPDLPDSVFVEDPALVLDELAVMCSPCPSRRREIESMRSLLEEYRSIEYIPAHARFEGGDVIADGRKLFVGQSSRTDRQGLKCLEALLQPLGYQIEPAEVRHSLHLSTAASYLGDGTFLVQPKWMDVTCFSGYRCIAVPDEEPWAANVLSIGGSVILPAGQPRTAEMLQRLGYAVEAVDVSELLKAEAGVTCMGLIFNAKASSVPAGVGPLHLSQTAS